MDDSNQLFGADEAANKESDNESDSSSSTSGSGSGSGSQSGSNPNSPAPETQLKASHNSSPAQPASPASSDGSSSGSSSRSSSPARSEQGSAAKPASPAKSASGSPARSASGSPARPASGSPARSASGSPARSASGSPARSASGSPARSASGSPARSASGSPGSGAAEDNNKPNIESSPQATPRRNSQSGSDSSPHRPGSADSVVGGGDAKKLLRLPSDSGSDPDAVRATAEDIFGEADDISEDEKEKEAQKSDEEKEEEVPETRIEVEIPRVVADLGENLSFAKLPNFLSVETRPFDPEQYEDEIDEDEVMDEEGRARLKLKVENTIRWRYVKDEAGNIKTDEFGEKMRESNAKMVKWSDGSLSLHLGSEIFDVFSMPMQDHNHLYIRQGTGLQGQAMFKNKLTFRPHSTDSFTHRKMTMSLADRSTKSAKTKVLPIAGVDPELSKTDNIKKEEERLRASIRRENQQRRTRERAHNRSSLDANFLDDEMDVSVAAIKNKYKKSKNAKRDRSVELSDSAEEDYETDGEEDLKRKRLQKAKRLADSDDNSSSAEQDSGNETVKKKSRVMSGSDSD